MTLHVWTDGDILYSEDLNNNFKNIRKIVEIYTGTDLDFTEVLQGYTVNKSYEFSTKPTTLRNYIDIFFNFSARMIWQNTYIEGDISLTIEIKQLGGSYSTIFSGSLLSLFANSANVGVYGGNFNYLHELTTGQKTNGYQIKFTITSGVGHAKLLSNKQIIFTELGV